MDIKAINTYLEHPELLTTQDLPVLNYIINKYPYFQAARTLQLKILKDNGSYLYNQRLKETAAYTTDRAILFDFITSPLFKNEKSNNEEKKSHTSDNINFNTKEELTNLKVESEIATQVSEEVISTPYDTLSESEVYQINDPELFQPKEEIEVTSIREELTQQPLDFDKNEIHSFNEWLKLSSLKVVHRTHPTLKETNNSNIETSEIVEIHNPPKKKKISSDLIDKFIENTPKIAPLKKVENQINLAKLNNTDPNDLMTETLAKVYLVQHNYKKAIQAYKILSLKNPEKSGFFADQIRKIEKLQANK